jgi:hypothetical protein
MPEKKRISRITILTDRVLIIRHGEYSPAPASRERDWEEVSLAVANRLARMEEKEEHCEPRQARFSISRYAAHVLELLAGYFNKRH